MYENFIKQLELYILTKDDLTIARHVFVYRAKNALLHEIVEFFLSLKDTDKTAILASYV